MYDIGIIHIYVIVYLQDEIVEMYTLFLDGYLIKMLTDMRPRIFMLQR